MTRVKDESARSKWSNKDSGSFSCSKVVSAASATAPPWRGWDWWTACSSSALVFRSSLQLGVAYPLITQHNSGKSPFLMVKSTINSHFP